MRRLLFVVALLAAVLPTGGQSALAQVAPLSPFSGYSTGTAVHIDALQIGDQRVADIEVAFSGANVNSQNIGPALANEMDQAYQQATTEADKAAGRGSGAEVGLVTVTPNVDGANQVNPGSTVQAFAPVSTGLLRDNFLDLDLDPVINSGYLEGQAQAVYSDSVCVLGQPISSGMGYAATAALVGTPTPEQLLQTNTGDNAVNMSKSFTYLIPNIVNGAADGTYGLVTETHQILAPVTVFPGTTALPEAIQGILAALPIPIALGEITIEFGGEWVLRSTATGKPGGATVEYAVVGADTPETKVIRVMLGETELAFVTSQMILDKDGLEVELPLELGIISIGAPPRAINGDFNSLPETLANGTKAAAAVDVVQITGQLAELGLADVRVGHMESMATVPMGGIQCGIPVTKTGNPTTVTAGDGQTVTYTITVPADPEAFKVIACDIVNLKVVDVVSTNIPEVKFTLKTASAPGVITGGNTITWDLGTYKPGDPSKVLTVTMEVPENSASGQITDTATATAVLGNCKGNASADATSLTGLAKLDATALSGNATLAIPGTSVLAKALVPAPQGPTPIGGVQTGAGGTSPISSRMLPIGTALASVALVASLTAWRRRRNG
jgi:hypothetical protein